MTSTRSAIVLFLVFALGYFFSALLRAVTATLAPQFSAELGLSAADLGLLAGVFFGGFALTQLPLGSALDRYGPKRVLLCFMCVAVLACGGFAVARSFETLLLARALMGVGLSAGLMAALTCFRHAYAPATQLRATSWMLMTGSLGMLTSTLPVHALLPWVGWRGLFWICAAGVACCAVLIAWVVPGDTPPAASQGPTGLAAYASIWRHPTFRRLMPLGFWHYGGLIAVQTLWAGPWMTQVTGLDASSAAQGLFGINFAMLVSFATLGALAPRWARHGWGAERLVRWVAPFSAAGLACIAVAGEAAGPVALAAWCVSCVALSLSQPAVGQAFSSDLVGRALSAFNLVIFLGVFCVQWGLGLVIDLLVRLGSSRVHAFQGALGILAIGCAACYLWFLLHGARPQPLAAAAAAAPAAPAKGAE